MMPQIKSSHSMYLPLFFFSWVKNKHTHNTPTLGQTHARFKISLIIFCDRQNAAVFKIHTVQNVQCNSELWKLWWQLMKPSTRSMIHEYSTNSGYICNLVINVLNVRIYNRIFFLLNTQKVELTAAPVNCLISCHNSHFKQNTYSPLVALSTKHDPQH